MWSTACAGTASPSSTSPTAPPACCRWSRRPGADVIGVDWRVDLDTAWAQLDDAAVQGNLDPAALLGPTEAIEERIADVLRRAGGRPGHIFNLGHGLLPETPPEHVGYLVDAVHRLSARGSEAAGGPDGPAAAQAAKEDA